MKYSYNLGRQVEVDSMNTNLREIENKINKTHIRNINYKKKYQNAK